MSNIQRTAYPGQLSEKPEWWLGRDWIDDQVNLFNALGHFAIRGDVEAALIISESITAKQLVINRLLTLMPNNYEAYDGAIKIAASETELEHRKELLSLANAHRSAWEKDSTIRRAIRFMGF